MSRDSNTEKLGKIVVNVFRTGVSIGFGVMIWLQSNTVSQKEFQASEKAHDREQALRLETLTVKFDTIQNELKRINTKLDRLAIYDPPRLEPELKGKL